MKSILRILWAAFIVLPWLLIAVAALAWASTIKIGAAIALFCVIMAVLAWDELAGDSEVRKSTTKYDKVR